MKFTTLAPLLLVGICFLRGAMGCSSRNAYCDDRKAQCEHNCHREAEACQTSTTAAPPTTTAAPTTAPPTTTCICVSTTTTTAAPTTATTPAAPCYCSSPPAPCHCPNHPAPPPVRPGCDRNSEVLHDKYGNYIYAGSKVDGYNHYKVSSYDSGCVSGDCVAESHFYDRGLGRSPIVSLDGEPRVFVSRRKRGLKEADLQRRRRSLESRSSKMQLTR